ncbi:melatonin receptor type 1B-like [Lingula anatina]|uniref:Melatonin receptor type 1B-like n=1 Tax=Lingula anatina TaxID=7574 RepID=A0A2R2MQI5_LINAN|nr:melatonin receptor type 1B-like [Lingula anatina]|eukprot:XP_023932418.1 melatonin receptor type 1B-like [Lingula anatina]
MLPEFSILLSGCSVWHSALIAIHRYLVVVKNNFYQSMSKTLYVVLVLFLTRIIPLLAVVPSFFARMSQYVPKLLRCVISSAYSARTLASISVIIIIPSIIVVVCFATIFIYVRRVQRNMHLVQTSVRREIQITKMFGVTFLIFVIGYLIYGVVRVVDKKNNLDADVYVFVSVLHHIGTCLNPVIYGLMNQQIRNTCLKTVGKDKQNKTKKKIKDKKAQNHHGRQSLETRSYLQCSSESDPNPTPKTSLTTTGNLAVAIKGT